MYIYFKSLTMKGKELKKLIRDKELSQEKAAKLLNITRQTLNIWCKMEEIPDKILHKVKKTFDVEIKKINENSCEKNHLYDLIECQKSEISSLKETIQTQKDLISELKEKIETLKNGDVPTALKIVSESLRKYGEKPK